MAGLYITKKKQNKEAISDNWWFAGLSIILLLTALVKRKAVKNGFSRQGNVWRAFLTGKTGKIWLDYPVHGKAGSVLAAVLLATGAGSQNMAVQAAESSTESVSSDLADGKYAVDVTLEGGSGRATISSPAILTVENGQATARIEWSSSHYDYMKVGDVQYDPVNEEGNSVFQIPVTVFDEPMEVVADTTAMSVPHEIEYTLTFNSASLRSEKSVVTQQRIIMLVVIVAAAVTIVLIKKKKAKKM